MRKIVNDKIILFSLFTLVCGLSFYFVLNSNASDIKKVSVNDEIQLGDVRDSCVTKDYDRCGCNSLSNYTAQEQCRKGCSYCATCKSGSYLSEGYCYKVTSSTVTDVSVSGKDYVYLAADESATFTLKASSNSSDFAPSWSFSPTSGASGRSAGTFYYLTASGTGSGTGSSCKETAYTVVATSNNTSKSATVKVCRYCSKWNGPYSTSAVYKNRQNTSKEASGCYYFYGEKQVEGGWTYSGYYNRCCGSVTPPPPSTPTPTPTPVPKACYGNSKYLGIATNVGWQESATTERPYKYDGIKEDDCHVIDVSTCSSSPISPTAIEINTDVCEDTKEISYQDVTKCSNYSNSTENNFYTIECNRKIVTSFDYGDDSNTNTSRFLYKGQGFKYGITVTSSHTCTARFNKDVWVNTYNKLLRKIGYVNSSLVNYVKNYDKNGWTKAVNALNATKEVKSEVYALWNTIESLRNIVIDEYLGFIPNNEYDEQVNLILKYNSNGKTNTQNEQLVISDFNSTEGEYSKVVSSVKYNLTNSSDLKNVPEYYVISNESSPRIMKFIPQNAYIDKYLGLDIGVDAGDTVNGGNKIYLNYNVDATTNSKPYTMSITVSGLGSNKSKVINDKCDINVGGEELLYRPIDVTNPFIDSKWSIGQNWLNNKYSFTNTIKSDTWSMSKLYDISLSNEDIASLKDSNKSNKDKYPYLGLCDRIKTTMQDSITKKICGMIKSAID